jgi:hypothetical protein
MYIPNVQEVLAVGLAAVGCMSFGKDSMRILFSFSVSGGERGGDDGRGGECVVYSALHHDFPGSCLTPPFSVTLYEFN